MTKPATDRPVKVKDIAGQKFNFLTAVSFIGVFGKKRHAKWLYQCDCGNQVEAYASNVSPGKTKSCGCYSVKARVRHGMSHERTYKIYHGILARCYNPDVAHYDRYGGRGITVCDRWRESFQNFFDDMGEQPEGMSIDRINPFGNYEPTNCRWADRITQMNNTCRQWIAKGHSQAAVQSNIEQRRELIARVRA